MSGQGGGLTWPGSLSVLSLSCWPLVLLFQVPNAQQIYKDMAEAGVVARYRGHELHCTDCIRVTVGKPTENDSFLQLFSKVANKYLAKIT